MTENPPKDAPDKTEYHAKCKQAKSLDKPRLTRGLLLLYDKLVNKCVWCDHPKKRVWHLLFQKKKIAPYLKRSQKFSKEILPRSHVAYVFGVFGVYFLLLF